MSPDSENAASDGHTAERHEGRLDNWNDARGFGFLTPSDGGPNIFVHVSAMPKTGKQISAGQAYTFRVETDATGRSRAIDVQPVVALAETREAPRKGPTLFQKIVQRGPRLLVIPAFGFIVLAIASIQPVSMNWLTIYGVASVACFCGYGLDKRAAAHKEWRVSETILLLIGLVGGWPGAIVGQEMFRHKTQKPAFRALFWMSVAINMAAFVQINVFSPG